MIDRRNWKLTKAYLRYRIDVDGVGASSAEVERTYLRHILEWADDRSFVGVKGIRPVLPDYVIQLSGGRKKERLSNVHVTKILATGRRFFGWAAANYSEYRPLKGGWIATLKARRLDKVPEKVPSVSLAEVRAIAAAPVANLVEERIRAAAVFWFLSGMRIGAFVSLPIMAVDIEKMLVQQDPRLGVRTKNRKYGVTTLLDIPDLLPVVERWDSKVRGVLPGAGYWFAPLSHDTSQFDLGHAEIGLHRVAIARKNFRDWAGKVGLKYRSPHAFRHGHIHYGLEHSRTMADFKAVSLNVMHSKIQTTDEVYSRLSVEEVHTRVGALGHVKQGQSGDMESDFQLFLKFKEWLEENK